MVCSFGFYSLNARFSGILTFWLPSFIASQLAFNRVSQGTQSILLTNIYETVMAPFISYSVISDAVLKSKKDLQLLIKAIILIKNIITGAYLYHF